MDDARWREADCPVAAGDEVGGKYRVQRVLGVGGMGVVVAATQIDLDRTVALKFLIPRALEHPDHVTRFAREARAAAKLQGEHVTRVLDVGTLDGGMAYIVMEYLEGEDLGRLLARRGPLPWAEAVGYILQACEGVAEAHALGIVHRDLKPANLFLANRPNGQPIIKVLDFGLSKISGSDERVTSESAILGSPVYMAPEQLMSSHRADERSDVWSIGVALYELLTARPPFPAQLMPALVAAILHGNEEPLEAHRADLPAELPPIVHRCLQKDPAKRFADVAQFAIALGRLGFASHRASVARIAHLLARSEAGSSARQQDVMSTLDAPEPAREVESPSASPLLGRSLAGASQSVIPRLSGAEAMSAGLRIIRRGRRRRLAIATTAAVATATSLGVLASFRPHAPAREADRASSAGVADRSPRRPIEGAIGPAASSSPPSTSPIPVVSTAAVTASASTFSAAPVASASSAKPIAPPPLGASLISRAFLPDAAAPSAPADTSFRARSGGAGVAGSAPPPAPTAPADPLGRLRRL